MDLGVDGIQKFEEKFYFSWKSVV